MKKKTMNKINLNKYLEQYDANILEVSKFLVSNNWFNIEPILEKGRVFLYENDFLRIKGKIDLFCKNNNKSEEEKTNLLLNMMNKTLPKTTEILKVFYSKNKCNPHVTYILSDFILYNLPGELTTSIDKEIQDLLDCACNELSKGYCKILCSLILWTKENYKVSYQNVYKMEQSKQANNTAYDENEYLNILYKLFNNEYITNNCMYENAADSKNYIDTWLFLSLHFVCSLRKTDLFCLPHPKLTLPPNVILEQVKNGTFSNEDARAILYSIIYTLQFNPKKPNKTKEVSNVSDIKFFIPESVEVHFGILFAVAESHYQIEKCDGPLIRDISKYDQISRYMGEDIGELFLYSDFKSRAANKSYLQMIEILTDEVLENNSNKINGYMLAALARSHKGSFGEFAKTTATYLKDAKTNGFTPEFVGKELFERGVLSFIVSKLLSVITNGKYDDIPFQDQTKIIKKIGITPHEIETLVIATQKLINNSNKVVNQLLKDEDDIKLLLHRIASKDVNSKDSNGLCLIHALGKVCPYKNRNVCINCEYEIGTKFTMIILLFEYKRLLSEYHNTSELLVKEKNKYLASEIILQKMDELLKCLEENYGKETIAALEKLMEVI